MPVIERSPMYDIFGPGAFIENNTRLNDLAPTSARKNPFATSRLLGGLIGSDLMVANQAPPEAFTRLALSGEQRARDRKLHLLGFHILF